METKRLGNQLPTSFASLVEASGWWSNKTSRWHRGLPLNISFLLKPNFRHSCIPLFKRKNVEAAVILPIHLRTPIQILVECNRLRCNSMWVLSARAARECINGKWMPQSAFDELLVSFFNPLLATNWCCTWTTELVNRCNRTDNQIRQIGLRWMVGCKCRKTFSPARKSNKKEMKVNALIQLLCIEYRSPNSWVQMVRIWSEKCVGSTDSKDSPAVAVKYKSTGCKEE